MNPDENRTGLRLMWSYYKTYRLFQVVCTCGYTYQCARDAHIPLFHQMGYPLSQVRYHQKKAHA